MILEKALTSETLKEEADTIAKAILRSDLVDDSTKSIIDSFPSGFKDLILETVLKHIAENPDLREKFQKELQRKKATNRWRMSINIDKQRGADLADNLLHAYDTVGIHGQKEMPEDSLPKGLQRGGTEHLIFLALTCSIDYQRDAESLWASSRRSFSDPELRFLFDPEALSQTPLMDIIRGMGTYGLSKKPRRDAWIWKTVGTTFYKKWEGNPRNFLSDCGYEASNVLHRLKTDAHEQENTVVWDFPYLRGNKIGPMWLRMLRDNAGISALKNFDKIPIPVDVHVARATLSTGIIRGQAVLSTDELYAIVRNAWDSIYELRRSSNKLGVPLDIDEPLWHLSREGCSKRDVNTGICKVIDKCEVSDFCVAGMIKKGENGLWHIST